MRAILYPLKDQAPGDILSITGDSHHHLSVARVRTGDEVLILNGHGLRAISVVSQVAKNNIELKIAACEEAVPAHELSVAMAMPKKEAFEDMLKMAVELGIRTIYPLTSQFSQYEYVETERVQRLLESALLQSNNGFFPVIHPQQKLSEFLKSHESEIVFFNSQEKTPNALKKEKAKRTVLIGPEGGFSKEEIENILQFPRSVEIHLPTPILRAPTALATATGYLLASL